jgi:hypothetical protein
MKCTIIGSTQYKDKFIALQEKLLAEGAEVRIPAFDDHKDLDELGVCLYNKDLIRWADRIYIIWDQRSTGTIFDFGMAFMANKPVEIVYMEEKTFRGVMEKYSKITQGE